MLFPLWFLVWVSVGLFWFSLSPSVSLISIVLFTLSSSSVALLTGEISVVGTTFLALAIIGGLFVLISFIILSFPQDLEASLTSVFPSPLLLGWVSATSFLSASYLTLNPIVGGKSLSKGESFTLIVGTSFHELTLLSVLFLLLLFLFMIDSMVKHDGGSFLSPSS